MTRIVAAGISPSPFDQELVLLETLKSLLEAAIASLSGDEAGALIEVSRQIRSTADEVIALSAQLANLPSNPEAQQQRRKLLGELGQQRAFCRAMLRRWRRSVLLRQQLLGRQTESVPYTESLEAGWY